MSGLVEDLRKAVKGAREAQQVRHREWCESSGNKVPDYRRHAKKLLAESRGEEYEAEGKEHEVIALD
jgi:hypothetical protein